ncbi:AAA family ATPase [Xanthomonas campestris pv. cannae]|nr:AAA family ATPase [Xanthomonas campestris pv. cannae]
MPLKFVSAVNHDDEVIKFGEITVLVGPNNSGKSQTLRDLRDFALGSPEEKLTLFKSIEVEMPSGGDFKGYFNVLDSKGSPTNEVVAGLDESLVKNHTINSQIGWWKKVVEGADQRSQRQSFGRFLISHLHAGTRFELTVPQQAYDLETESPEHALQEFFCQRLEVQPKLRKAFAEAFERDIALDWTPMKRWYFKVGKSFGEISESLKDLRQQLSSSQLLQEQGDGYQSFAGILMAALVFPSRVLLLDEPEAFLHPKQARVLGRLLGRISIDRPAQIIVSTHSSAFMWGVVNENNDASVLRLNRTENQTRYTQVPAETVTGLTRTPLLSSQPVLDSLFHKGVVVCEGDPDRAVYQLVSQRMLGDKGGDDLLFIHTNGKGAADTPIQLLRSAGAPVAVILDIDILNASSPLDKVVKALTGIDIPEEIEKKRAEISRWVLQMPEEEFLGKLLDGVRDWIASPHSDARSSRKRLEATIKEMTSKWDVVKKAGESYFVGEQLVAIRGLMKDLTSFGIFVVPCGELEKWIDTGASKGREWNRKALEKIQTEGCPADLEIFMQGVVDYFNVSAANAAIYP